MLKSVMAKLNNIVKWHLFSNNVLLGLLSISLQK